MKIENICIGSLEGLIYRVSGKKGNRYFKYIFLYMFCLIVLCFFEGMLEFVLTLFYGIYTWVPFCSCILGGYLYLLKVKTHGPWDKATCYETGWSCLSYIIDFISSSLFIILNAFMLHLGYFAIDTDSTPEKLVFNRTVTLRDSFSKGGK
jgi:hypothetical protein